MGTTGPDFEAFVVARGPSLVRFAHGLTGSRELGEDLTQDCLIKAHRRWDKIRTDPERYLRTAIVHELVSWRRRRRHHEQPGAVPERQVDAPADALVEHDAMWQVLRQLPVRQRAVLVLRYWKRSPMPRSLCCSGSPKAAYGAAPPVPSPSCANTPTSLT